jgi:Domain of unknown function (DUF5919)
MPKHEPGYSEFLKIIDRQKSAIASLVIAFVGVMLIFLPTTLGADKALSEFLNLLGIALVPSGLVSFIYDYALRQTFLQEMRSQLIESMRSEFSQLFEIRDAGIQAIHHEYPTDRLIKGLSKAQVHIRILVIWIPDLIRIEQSFSDAVKHGCKIQILLLHPKSDFAKYRSRDLGTNDNYTSMEILANLLELSRFCRENNITEKIEIKLYKDATPTVFFIGYDDTFIFGSFLQHKMGIHTNQIEVKGTNSPFVNALNDHFEAIWNTATPYSAVEHLNYDITT